MALISDVKCGKCDRRYSGLRARCPYCGYRRGKNGKRSSDSGNSAGRIAVGLILIAVLLIAVIILIVSSAREKEKEMEVPETDVTQTVQGDEDVTSVTGAEVKATGEEDENAYTAEETPQPTPEEPEQDPEPEPEPEIEISEVRVQWGTTVETDFTLERGTSLNMTWGTSPYVSEETAEVSWESSDESVFTVTQTGEVTAVSGGVAELTVTVNGVSSEPCIVRVSE